jgi:hypothetical protein
VKIAADMLLIVHFAFILFVILGALLALRWPRVIWFHLPAAAWGAATEFFGWVCPLTPLEQYFRRAAGQGTYGGGFVEHYLLPLIYPAGLSRGIQLGLGLVLVLVNGLIYAWLWKRARG